MVDTILLHGHEVTLQELNSLILENGCTEDTLNESVINISNESIQFNDWYSLKEWAFNQGWSIATEDGICTFSGD